MQASATQAISKSQLKRLDAQTGQERKVIVLIGDRDGRAGKYFANDGAKVFCYHKTHDDEEIDFNTESRGMIFKVGPELDIAIRQIEIMAEIDGHPVDSVSVIGRISEADLKMIKDSAFGNKLNHL